VSDNDIPIIMLLIGGDFATLAAMCKGLAVGTPVVVVRVCSHQNDKLKTKSVLVYHTSSPVRMKYYNIFHNPRPTGYFENLFRSLGWIQIFRYLYPQRICCRSKSNALFVQRIHPILNKRECCIIDN
jgi:hypothetical protein